MGHKDKMMKTFLAFMLLIVLGQSKGKIQATATLYSDSQCTKEVNHEGKKITGTESINLGTEDNELQCVKDGLIKVPVIGFESFDIKNGGCIKVDVLKIVN